MKIQIRAERWEWLSPKKILDFDLVKHLLQPDIVSKPTKFTLEGLLTLKLPKCIFLVILKRLKSAFRLKSGMPENGTRRNSFVRRDV